MVRLLSLFGLLLLGSESLYSECHLSEVVTAAGDRRVVLENDQIRVGILPSSNARVISFILKSSGEEFFTELQETQTEISPLLPRSTQSNGAGFKDWIWGRTVPAGVPFTMKTLVSTPDEIVVELRGELGIFDLKKRFRLRRDSAVLEQTVTFTNPLSRPMKLDYWVHLLLNPEVFCERNPTRGLFALALTNKSKLIRGKKTEALGRREVVTGMVGSSYHFFAPIEPWLARISPRSGTALLVHVQPETDSLASVWQSDDATSLEWVFPQKELSAGESVSFQVNLVAIPQAGRIVASFPSFLISEVNGDIVLRPFEKTDRTKWTLPQTKDAAEAIVVPPLNALAEYPLGSVAKFLAGEAILYHNEQRTEALFSPSGSVQFLSEP